MKKVFFLICIISFYLSIPICMARIPSASVYNFTKEFEIKNITLQMQGEEQEVIIEVEYIRPDSFNMEKPQFKFVPIRLSRHYECEGIIIRQDYNNSSSHGLKDTTTINVNIKNVFGISDCDIVVMGPSKYYIASIFPFGVRSYEYKE
ncbi:MAG: hypothetical protein HQK50_06120 [Oligoflexia bacterium]|nr:hypothetical protein [Oligoflexia bacterium]MBF0365127.1 hypothetical protein [Oligoflexia bacterium]